MLTTTLIPHDVLRSKIGKRRDAITTFREHKIEQTPSPDLVHAAELELRLLLGDAVKHEASLGVVQQAEQVA